MPKYPNITAKLLGADGNAFNLLGITQRALRAGGVPEEEVQAFHKEATSGNYDNLLATIMSWVEVE
jgi:hypothetical protein